MSPSWKLRQQALPWRKAALQCHKPLGYFLSCKMNCITGVLLCEKKQLQVTLSVFQSVRFLKKIFMAHSYIATINFLLPKWFLFLSGWEWTLRKQNKTKDHKKPPTTLSEWLTLFFPLWQKAWSVVSLLSRSQLQSLFKNHHRMFFSI